MVCWWLCLVDLFEFFLYGELVCFDCFELGVDFVEFVNCFG